MTDNPDKLDLYSHDIVEEKRQELLRLSPEICTEGGKLDFEQLKLLQKSYLGKVKMIYIDPPYNTGNDFIYPITTPRACRPTWSTPGRVTESW
jgi:adenine specific DNA methylase Mod